MAAVVRSYGVDRETELELVRGVRAGEEAAFDAIYSVFNVRLLAFLVRLMRRREVAEDLLEETWLRFVAVHGRTQSARQLLSHPRIRIGCRRQSESLANADRRYAIRAGGAY